MEGFAAWALLAVLAGTVVFCWWMFFDWITSQKAYWPGMRKGDFAVWWFIGGFLTTGLIIPILSIYYWFRVRPFTRHKARFCVNCGHKDIDHRQRDGSNGQCRLCPCPFAELRTAQSPR